MVKYPFTTCDPAFVRAGPKIGSLVFRLACTLHNPVSVRRRGRVPSVSLASPRFPSSLSPAPAPSQVEFLPPYHPSAAERNDAELFASNVRALMADCMGVPATDHSYDDVRLMVRARRLATGTHGGPASRAQTQRPRLTHRRPPPAQTEAQRLHLPPEVASLEVATLEQVRHARCVDVGRVARCSSSPLAPGGGGDKGLNRGLQPVVWR